MSEGGGELVFRWYLIVSSMVFQVYTYTYDRRSWEKAAKEGLNCNQCRKEGTGPMYPYPHASRCSVYQEK